MQGEERRCKKEVIEAFPAQKGGHRQELAFVGVKGKRKADLNSYEVKKAE